MNRHEGRIALLARTAEKTCGFLSKSLDASTEMFFVDASALSECVKSYFDHVDKFKSDHNYPEDGLINASKQAAFTVQAILTARPIKAMGNVDDTIHVHLANDIFALRAATNLLRVRLSDVPQVV